MSALSDIVQVSITSESSKVSQQGFGLPLILSHSAAWPGQSVRSYNEISEVAVDFAATTPEYKAALKLLSAEPRPPTIKIGKAPTPITQRFAVTPIAINLYTYRMTVNGVAVSFTSDGTATLPEIIAGLKAAIDALALPITVSDQTTYMRVIVNSANAFVALGSEDANLRVKQDHADPGVTADLNALVAVDNEFYGLVTLFNSQPYAVAVAAWAEAAKKLYASQTEDGNVPNTSASGTDDVAEQIKSLAYDQTAVIFSARTDDFADAAWLGKNLPVMPGEETWKFKTLAGVQVGKFTPTQRANMRAKNCNFYELTAGIPMTEEGIVGSGKYIDAVRYVNYKVARLAERVFGPLASNAKLPFNNRGIQTVGAAMRAQMAYDESREAILPGWSVKLPVETEVAAADRTNRVLRNAYFSEVYAGAIHKVVINGTITF